MRSSLIVLFFAALALPAAAFAKGPDNASLSGPGISGSIRIEGDGEAGPGTPLGDLVTYGGFFTQMFGHHPNDPTRRTRPPGKLGPRYHVRYSVPTPNGRWPIVADVYPYAIPRAVTYMKPGQPFYRGMLTHGGWYIAKPGFRHALLDAGLPDRAHGGGATHALRWLGIVAATLTALGATAAILLLRRRPQSTPAPAS